MDLNGDNWCDWCQYMTSCDSWHCIIWVSRSSKVTWGHWSRLTSQWPIANRYMFSGVSWGAEYEFLVSCSQKCSKPLLSHPLGQSSSFDQFEFWPLRRSQPARVMPFYLGALATTYLYFNPRRHRGGGLMQPPLRFFWNIFFVNRSIVTIFSIAFRPSFLRPPENFKTLIPLKFYLWRHNWGHFRRKMRSVGHNLQTSPFLLVIWMWTCSTK